MSKNVIKSDTAKKVEKILNGQFFNGHYTLITEFFQNAQRAKAKNVYVTLNQESLLFKDDGCGLKTPEAITTLDFSSWDSTNEGFGIGFWSCIAVPQVQEVEVFSNKFKVHLDLNEVRDVLTNKVKRAEGIPVKVSNIEEAVKGFSVKVTSPYFYDEFNKYKDEIIKIGQLMPFNVFLNNELIPRKDLFQEIKEQNSFTIEYNTKLFNGVLAPSKSSNDYIQLFYEGRFVNYLYRYPFVNGIIEIKPNSLTLKEPDRTSYVYDDKSYKFRKRVKDVIISLYKSFLNELMSNNQDILTDEYSSAFTEYLNSKDYEKILYVDFEDSKSIKNVINEVAIKITEGVVETEDILNSLNVLNKDCNWVQVSECEVENHLECMDISKAIIENNNEFLENISEEIISVGDKYFKQIKSTENTNVMVQENEMPIENNEFGEYDDINIKNTVNLNDSVIIKRPTLKSIIKKNKAVMWVKAFEQDRYLNSISLAEYYDIKVIIAKNSMYEKFLKDNNITHISQMEGAINKTYTFKDIKCKSLKEEAFLTLLEPIRKHYKLPKDTFKIADISQLVEIVIDYEIVKTIKYNKNNKNRVYGVCDGHNIIFDRKALDLKKFNISLNDKNCLNVGKNELKCLMYNMNTIAHELAHLLYNTVDNTKAHTEMENLIQKQIIELFITM